MVSYHSSGGHSSSARFHDHDWLDFNSVQSFHTSGDPNYRYIEADYRLSPTKPTLDVEARYEDIPDNGDRRNASYWEGVQDPDGVRGRRIDAHQVREAAYWAVLAGAAGHGYGHNSIWQMHDKTKVDSTTDYSFPLIPPTVNWVTAMDSVGAHGMEYLHRLLRIRPWHQMEPDQTVIASGQGDGERHIQASRAVDGGFVLAYLPLGDPVAVSMDRVAGPVVRAHWYDPRTGLLSPVGAYPCVGVREFSPPTSGHQNDWVLVLDDASRNWPVAQ
jgi:hypothetical protein